MNKHQDILSSVNHIDYKDVDLLKSFLTPHGKIMGRKRSGVSVKNQRRISKAIKRARFMGLIPFTFQ